VNSSATIWANAWSAISWQRRCGARPNSKRMTHARARRIAQPTRLPGSRIELIREGFRNRQ
jgi:hypothetical protein